MNHCIFRLFYWTKFSNHFVYLPFPRRALKQLKAKFLIISFTFPFVSNGDELLKSQKYNNFQHDWPFHWHHLRWIPKNFSAESVNNCAKAFSLHLCFSKSRSIRLQRLNSILFKFWVQGQNTCSWAQSGLMRFDWNMNQKDQRT